MNKSKLVRLSWIVWGSMLVWQILLIIFFRGEQFADFKEYVDKAREIVAANAWYPRVSDLSGVMYLHAPGYVNFIALLFRVVNHDAILFVFNLLFVEGILFAGKSILEYLHREDALKEQKLAVYQIVFCIYFMISMSGGIVIANTEMMFCALAFGSMAIFLKNKPWLWCVAGIIMGIANSIRPVVFLFVPAVLVLGVYYIRRETNSKWLMQLGIYLGSMLATIGVFGLISVLNCGDFVTQSTTMGVNLLVGNSPVADGNNQYHVFEEGNVGYVDYAEHPDWTYAEYEQFYQDTALTWMKENPGSVLALIPRRMFYLWAIDTYFVTGYSGNTVLTDTAEYLSSVAQKLISFRWNEMAFVDWMACLSEGVYVLLLVMFIVALVVHVRHKVWKRYLALYAILVLGIGMHAIMFGYARFHFPFMVVIVMLCIDAFFARKDAPCKVEKF